MTAGQFWTVVAASAVGVLLACAVTSAIVWLHGAIVRRREAQRAPALPSLPPTPLPVADEPLDEGKLRVAVRRSVNETLLVGPPMVDGETLFSYLKHHAPPTYPAATWDTEGLGVWASVVETFYGAAGADPLIAHHFEGVDLTPLKRHFLRALFALAHSGLTVDVADGLGRKHAHLGITAVEYDATVGHLVATLKRYLRPAVFEDVIAQLVPAVEALRIRIVVPVGAQ